MEATVEAALAMAARRLDRHDARRRHGVPTVTVLTGRARESAAFLSRWAADRGRSLAWLESEWPEPSELAEAWTGRLAAGGCLVDEAIAWLERRLDRPAGSLGPSLRGKTPFELAIFLDRVLPSVSATGVETACRWALCDAAERGWREDVGTLSLLTASSEMSSNPGRWRAPASTPASASWWPSASSSRRSGSPCSSSPAGALGHRTRTGRSPGSSGPRGSLPTWPSPSPAWRPAWCWSPTCSGLTWTGPRSRGPRRSCGSRS